MQHIKKVLADYKLLLNNVPALVTVAFCVGTIWMNVAAGKIIFNVAGFAITGGFAISFLPFLCMDCTTRRFGARASIMLNILSAVFNVLFVAGLSLIAAIPTEQDYSEFNSVLGSVWFIVFGSTVAFVVSGVANSLINAAIGNLFHQKGAAEFFSRSFISTFLGQFIDNFLFMWIVYGIFAPIYWGMSLPITTCLGTAFIGGLLELLCEVIFAPLGLKICNQWEKDNVGHDYIEAHSTSTETE